MEARYMMAEAYSSLSRAGMSHAEFEAEINNCKDSTDAYRIALGWRNKAEAQIKSGKVVS
jgi:predicted GNAT superfamily acetyltransferase